MICTHSDVHTCMPQNINPASVSAQTTSTISMKRLMNWKQGYAILCEIQNLYRSFASRLFKTTLKDTSEAYD